MATERGYYKEELDRSIHNLEMALTHLSRVMEAYEKPHPEIATQVTECGEAIVLIAETIGKINESI